MTQVNIGKTIALDVDFAAFPQNVLDHILYIGARNILMDAHAGVTKEEAGDDMIPQARAVAEKKLAAMYAGEVRIGAMRAPRDAVGAVMARMARSEIVNALRAANRKPGDVAKDAMAAAITKRVTAHDARLRTAAERELAEVAARVSDIDLADIGLE